MFTGKIPFDHISNEFVVMGAILDGQRPPEPADAELIGFTGELWELMGRCWASERAARPLCSDALTIVSSTEAVDLISLGADLEDETLPREIIVHSRFNSIDGSVDELSPM